MLEQKATIAVAFAVADTRAAINGRAQHEDGSVVAVDGQAGWPELAQFVIRGVQFDDWPAIENVVDQPWLTVAAHILAVSRLVPPVLNAVAGGVYALAALEVHYEASARQGSCSAGCGGNEKISKRSDKQAGLAGGATQAPVVSNMGSNRAE